mgnify:CR=1 FL=1
MENNRIDLCAPEGETPIYDQIRQELAGRIRAGSLPDGTRLPTVRELSEQLHVAEGTVKRAYDELERDGLLIKTPGRGSFVCYHRTADRRQAAQEQIDALLQQLHAQGGKLAIVSNKPDEAVRALRAEFFADTVPIAVGEKQGIRRKPAPDTLLTAMAQLGAAPASTVYVGDSEVDIATARAAGLPCISVLWGFRDRDALEQAGAQQFAADAGELARLLD